MSIQTPYSNIVALVIDDMSTQQTTLRGQLSMLGFAKVDVASNAEDALRMIRLKPYGLILCDYNLNNKTDGQQLFEHLRDNGLLPATSLFFMVTAENSYASVASATEHKPDAYLLKPITASDVEERLKAQLERRAALAAVNQRLNRSDYSGAVDECNKLLVRKDRWFMQVLQLKGDALLQLGRHEDAKLVFMQALDLRPDLIWAKLGLARAHKAAGNFEDAKAVAYAIIHSPDGERNVAAYDVVAQSLEAQGDNEAAMWVLRDAAVVIPSARRQRLVAESAYRNGDLATATDSFMKVAKATKGSVIAQAQDTLALAQVLVDGGRMAEALSTLADAADGQRSNPQFEGVAAAISAQAHAKTGQVEAATKAALRARESLRQAKADFATIALAKAELMVGNEKAGLELLEAAVHCDHENPRVKQLINRALGDTGRADRADGLIKSAVQRLNVKVSDAKTLFRNSQIDEALAAIESAAREYPENTSVLLQAAQMNCMSLRLKKQVNNAVIEKVRLYMLRLDKLLPANDRVTQMQRYFRETVQALQLEATV